MRVLALFLTFWAISSVLFVTEAYSRSHTQAVNGTYALVSEINSAINSTSPNAHVGIAIKSMKLGDTLYAKNEQSLFVPASTLKMFTAEAALLYLGPNYQFPTRFMTNAKISDGKLYGDLYLVHSGDPSLTYSDLVELMANLKAQQIQEITGNVYIDITAYDQENTGPGWLGTDKRNPYGAPISASIINHNFLSFRVVPHGGMPQVVTGPTAFVGEVENSIVSKPHSRLKTCYVKLDGGQGGTIAIRGCTSKRSYGIGVSHVITDIVQYNKSMLTDLFKRSNIHVDGIITAGAAPTDSQALATHTSKPLKKLITEMLKMSDNVIAGSLFKKIGELYTHRPGSWENGGDSVGRILSQQAALDTWHINLIDGSGLSRYNQVTPAQMLQLLDFTYHNDATSYEFMSALPIAGVDGTLKRRMRNIAWRVRAKTGTMQGVVSLAGYAISQDKEPFAFVILINGRGSVWQYRELEDKILNLLTHYSRS